MVQKEGGHTHTSIITLNNLSKAIENRLGVDKKEAKRVAGIILDLFGYEDRVIDNNLHFDDRQLFYILEEEGILLSGREKATLYNGREWLTHYWQLNRDAILKFAQGIGKKSRNVLSTKRQSKNILKGEDIYSSITKEMWNARNIDRKEPFCYFFTCYFK